PKTVSVKNGVVTAKKLKKGEMKKKVTVTAAYNGESVPFVITVKASLPSIEAGQKGRKITAPKTVKASAGTSKTVTAAVKLPKALHGKEVRAKVVIPEKLPGTSVSDGNTENDFFDLGEGKPDAKGTKVSFAITPREAGAAYIVWTVTDESGNRSQAYTKVLIKKPLSTLSVNCPETGLDLSVGEGQRLIVTTTKGNTDPKDLSFSVKGRGVKVSKSGFVTAVTAGAKADVTVKAGKYKGKITVRAKDHAGSILALNKTSVNVKRPKEGAKPKTAALKVTMPKKNPPEVKWSITDSPKGIAVDPDGKVTVTSDASPGCYTVTAAPKDTGGAYNPVCCELIVR
nr:hypothetical protein [Lachnospiraceae bacterium]